MDNKKDIYWQGKIYVGYEYDHSFGTGRDYIEYLETLTSYPVHGNHSFTDGQTVVEGVDFECQGKHTGKGDNFRRTIVAVALLQDKDVLPQKEIIREAKLRHSGDSEYLEIGFINGAMWANKIWEQYRLQIALPLSSASEQGEKEGVIKTGEDVFMKLRLDDILPPMDAVNKRIFCETIDAAIYANKTAPVQQVQGKEVQTAEEFNPSESDKAGGWLYNTYFLKKIVDKVNMQPYGEGLGMEEVESVLEAINFKHLHQTSQFKTTPQEGHVNNRSQEGEQC